MILTTSLGTEVRVTPGIIDEAAEMAFMQGHCHVLTATLAEMTGWTPVVDTGEWKISGAHLARFARSAMPYGAGWRAARRRKCW